MAKIAEWRTAQVGEKRLWDGIVQADDALLEVLEGNCERAQQLRIRLTRIPRSSLEVGIGPLGIGITGYLPEIPSRFGIDPLERVSLNFSTPSPGRSSEKL